MNPWSVVGVVAGTALLITACGSSAVANGAGTGKTVVVSPGGNDAANCTRTEPCRSFDRAYRRAPSGGTVVVQAGRYGPQTINTDSTKRSAKDVVFRPAEGASVSVGQLNLHGRHFELRNFTVNADVLTYGTTADVTLRNLKIHGGFFIQSSQHVSIIGGSVGPGVDYHPMITSEWKNATPPRKILVDGVLFHDWTRSNDSVHTECLQIGGGDGIVVRDSRFRNCDVMDLHLTWYGDGPMTRNVTIENNFFSAAGDGGFYAIQVNAFKNLLVRNNSFGQAIKIFTGPGQGPNVNVRVFANVGPYEPWSCEDGVIYRYNVWNGTKCDATDVNAPSGFVNPERGDFHLRRFAAAINRGDPSSRPARDIDGDRRPQGNAADAGADERS